MVLGFMENTNRQAVCKLQKKSYTKNHKNTPQK